MKKLSSIGELFFTTTGRLLISVATFACLFFVFHLAGHFDLRQSTVLAFGTALLVNRKHPFRPKPRLFEPFRIRFFPDFAAMLVAVGLVED